MIALYPIGGKIMSGNIIIDQDGQLLDMGFSEDEIEILKKFVAQIQDSNSIKAINQKAINQSNAVQLRSDYKNDTSDIIKGCCDGNKKILDVGEKLIDDKDLTFEQKYIVYADMMRFQNKRNKEVCIHKAIKVVGYIAPNVIPAVVNMVLNK